MRLFIKYLKQRRRGIAAAVVSCGIFFITFALSRLPVKAVLYPTALCALLGILWMTVDFLRVRRKHTALQRIGSFADTLAEALPAADGIEEEDYQALIKLLDRTYVAYKTEAARRYSDMTDYYTVWVHQIKTPIASMKLQLQNEDSELSRRLSNDLFRVEQYVEMVLTFFRLNAESTDYVIRTYDLDGIIREAVKKYAGEFIGRKISFIYEPLHVAVTTDAKWLSFVIEQVLSNALKYTKPGGSISVTLTPVKTLCIRDTGIGIAPEDLPRIFENGYTGYNGRTDKKASGIGLYLCKRICLNLGHGISAESTVHEGTSVMIDLSQTKFEAE